MSMRKLFDAPRMTMAAIEWRRQLTLTSVPTTAPLLLFASFASRAASAFSRLSSSFSRFSRSFVLLLAFACVPQARLRVSRSKSHFKVVTVERSHTSRQLDTEKPYLFWGCSWYKAICRICIRMRLAFRDAVPSSGCMRRDCTICTSRA